MFMIFSYHLLTNILLSSAYAMESFSLYREISDAKTNLEGQVAERTSAIRHSNEQLRLEIAEREPCGRRPAKQQ